MSNNQILTDDEIQEGLILSCQAIPKSNKIKIDFDDVYLSSFKFFRIKYVIVKLLNIFV